MGSYVTSLGIGPLLHSTKSVAGKSSYGSVILIYEPWIEQMSSIRITLGILLIISSIICQYYVSKCLKVQNKLTKNNCNLYLINNISHRKNIIYLTWLTIICSSIHFLDNMMRPVDYYMPYWIHSGVLFIEDITVIYWIMFGVLTVYSLNKLLQLKNTLDDNNSFIFRIWLMYYCCFLIWNGQIHWAIAPYYEYSLICQLSILGEGIAAISLNLYMVYIYNKYKNNIYQLLNTQNPIDENESFLNVPSQNDGIRRRLSD